MVTSGFGIEGGYMDILDLLEERFGAFRFTNNNDAEIRFNCPNCTDRSFHLYINIEKKVLHCFKCGYSESLVRIFGRYLQACTSPSIKRVITFPKIDGIEPLDEADTYLAKLAREYCQSRDIIDKTLLYYGTSGEWFGRVVFPIIEDGKIVVATGRAFLTGILPKYYTQGEKSRFVYLLDKRIYSPYIVLCEGCMDALSCQNGIALMGKELSKFQIYKLYLMIPPEKPIYVALDPDAKQEGLKIAQKLIPHYRKVYFCNLPDGLDLNDLKGDWQSYPYYQITEHNFIRMSQNIMGM